MTKQIFQLIGIPGSGKSTWAKSYLGHQTDTSKVAYLSSDKIREQLSSKPPFAGKEFDEDTYQKLNQKVFSLMFKEYKKVLRDSNVTTIILDMTATSRKRRINWYQTSKSKLLPPTRFTSIIFMSSLTSAYTNVKKRSADGGLGVPKQVIKQMQINLQPPKIGLDCDKIMVTGESFFTTPTQMKNAINPKQDLLKVPYGKLYKANNRVTSLYQRFSDRLKVNEMKNFFTNHASKYHAENLDTHLSLCIANSNSSILSLLSLYHDLGKSLTKKFHEDGYAHYYEHENFSSIVLLNAIATQKYYTDNPNNSINNGYFNQLIDVSNSPQLFVVELVLDHMIYHTKAGLTDKIKKKRCLTYADIKHLKEFGHIDDKSTLKIVDN